MCSNLDIHHFFLWPWFFIALVMMLIIDLVQITHFQKKKHVDFQQEVFYRASLNIFCQKGKKEKRKEIIHMANF